MQASIAKKPTKELLKELSLTLINRESTPSIDLLSSDKVKLYKVEFYSKVFFDGIEIEIFCWLVDINNVFETPTWTSLKSGITSIVGKYKVLYSSRNSY